MRKLISNMAAITLNGLGDRPSRAVFLKLFDYLSENKVNEFKLLLEKQSKDTISKHIDLTFDEKNNFNLLTRAVFENNYKIVKILLEFGADVNIPIKSETSPNTALYLACQNNNTIIGKLLLDNGANPNHYDKSTFRTTLSEATWHKNIVMAQYLLDPNNKIPFLWNELINFSMRDGGFNVFLSACAGGNVDYLKYLFKIEKDKEQKQKGIKTIKIDIHSRTHKSRSIFSGLHHACLNNHTNMVEYLLTDVYYNSKSDGIFDINQSTIDGRTPFYFAAINGNVKLMKLMIELYPDCDVNYCDLSGVTPFSNACQLGHVEAVKFLLGLKKRGKNFKNSGSENKTNGGDESYVCQVNKQDLSSTTPLMKACGLGCIDVVFELASNERVNLFQKDKIARDALDIAAETGQFQCFQILLHFMIKRNNIKNWRQFEGLIKDLDERVKRWETHGNKDNLEAFLTFLFSLKTKVFDKKDFNLLQAMVDPSWIRNDNSNINEWLKYKESKLTAEYIYNGLIKHEDNNNTNQGKSDLSSVTKVISKIINDGIREQRCVFDDSWLFLSKLCDESSFLQTIITVADSSMPSSKNNAKSSEKRKSFWKNNLLNSNVFADSIDGGNNYNYSNDEKRNDIYNDENENKTADAVSGCTTVFDIIENEIIGKKLAAQQLFIKQSIIEMEKTMNESWQSVKQIDNFSIVFASDNIRQDTIQDRFTNYTDLMSKNGVKSDYSSITQLPSDGLNQFNGADVYDHNIYCSQLITRAHIIQPYFQNDCKKLFGNKYYTEGNVKSIERCIFKAKHDYKNYNFPRCANIIDPLRGSVICDTPQELIRLYNQFRVKVNQKKAGVIEKVVRIKNTLKLLPDGNSKEDGDLTGYRYGDIKANVIIEYKNMRIVGELQFLLSFCLEAKKIGHAFYSFLRKKEFYDELRLNTNKENLGQVVKSMILTYVLSKNKDKLAQLLQTMNQEEVKNVMNQENVKTIVNLIKANQWNKGLQLFESFGLLQSDTNGKFNS